MLRSTQGRYLYTSEDLWSERPSLLFKPWVRGRVWALKLLLLCLPNELSCLYYNSISGALTALTRHWYGGVQLSLSRRSEAKGRDGWLTSHCRVCNKGCESHTSVLWWPRGPEDASRLQRPSLGELANAGGSLSIRCTLCAVLAQCTWEHSPPGSCSTAEDRDVIASSQEAKAMLWRQDMKYDSMG